MGLTDTSSAKVLLVCNAYMYIAPDYVSLLYGYSLKKLNKHVVSSVAL